MPVCVGVGTAEVVFDPGVTVTTTTVVVVVVVTAIAGTPTQ